MLVSWWWMACTMSPADEELERPLPPEVPATPRSSDDDDGLEPAPDDTGAKVGPLEGSWSGSCMDAMPQPIPLPTQLDVPTLELTLTDTNGKLGGTFDLEVAYSPGGPSFIEVFEGDVSGTRVGVSFELTFDLADVKGLTLTGEWSDDDRLIGSMGVPQALVGVSGILDCRLER
ncbi:MAG: hypothetical protein AAGA48_41165 [Myxococcota bacterium]